MRRFLGVSAFATVVAGVGLVSAPVGAQDYPIFDIPLDTVERGDEGTELLLATEGIPTEDVGRECDVSAESANNSSVHPNTDLIVRSGGSEVEIVDVEQEADGTMEATGTLVLDSEVSVLVRFGPDEVFSGGMVVTLDCPTPPPSTTAPPVTDAPTTTTTEPETVTVTPAAPAQPVPAEPNFTG